MVGVHRVAQAVAPGQQAGGHQRAAVAKGLQRPAPGQKIRRDQPQHQTRGAAAGVKLSLSWLYSLSLPAGGGDHRLTIGDCAVAGRQLLCKQQSKIRQIKGQSRRQQAVMQHPAAADHRVDAADGGAVAGHRRQSTGQGVVECPGFLRRSRLPAQPLPPEGR